MKNIILHLLVSWLVSAIITPFSLGNTAPVVSNVQAQQQNMTRLVEISYDVADADNDYLTIMVLVSNDGSSTFTVRAQTFSGDVGWGITPGDGKQILWDARADVPGVSADNYQVMVFASDSILGEDGAEMVLVPAGEFAMGSSLYEGFQEYPQHTVFLNAFYIDRYEVTNAEYYQFWQADGEFNSFHSPRSYAVYNIGSWPLVAITKPNYPVVGITWDDAQAYALWTGKRLPTEAEWEKAARGADARIWPWGNQFDMNIDGTTVHANIWKGRREKGMIESVGMYPTGVSPYGVYDMAGNVWEWCADWFDYEYYHHSPGENPMGPETGDTRVIRGGSWYNTADLAQCSYRTGIDPNYRWYKLGFRCVQDFDLMRADEGFAKSNLFALDTKKAPSWDTNQDGVVDIQDLLLVVRHFGESGAEIPGDVNGDGVVDISDFVIIGRHFGEITEELTAPSITTD